MVAVLDHLEQQYGRVIGDDLRPRLQRLLANPDEVTVRTLSEIVQTEDPTSAIHKLLELIEDIEDERLIHERLRDGRPNRTPHDLFKALKNARPSGDD